LGERINANFPSVEVLLGSKDPSGFDLVVNATPLGMKEGDPMPVDVAKISPQTFVGEVVLKDEMTAFLSAAHQRGCKVQVGTDMLFEQIPVYLEYFGFESTTAEELRAVAKLND
jgi:shikimate dehydrogenase